MKNFTRLDTHNLILGMRFSAPVFFDDGENMFLAARKTIKPYHLAAIKRFDIKYLLTYGYLLSDNNDFDDDSIFELTEEVEELKTV